HMMTEFAGSDAGAEIEDPYYGDESGFDRTLLRLMESVTGILAVLRIEYGFPDGGGDER
ncbi:MAG TPA: low molecular weight phosphotyrosine protein phosphatase, partial [Chlorobaculum parvum]|nr:low molecular weight phosphotyrosine protein phosphatase [Chlorobaculum parvum]